MECGCQGGRELYLELGSCHILLLAQIQPPGVPPRALSWSPFSLCYLKAEKTQKNGRVGLGSKSAMKQKYRVLGNAREEHAIETKMFDF